MTLAKRSPMIVFRSVISALMFRELKTRFGEYRLGYLWAVLDPMFQVIILTLIFGSRGHQAMFGIDYPLFVLTGEMSYDLFAASLGQCTGAIEANEGLFVYKQVKPIDVIITRVVLEFIIHVFSFILLLMLAAWLGYGITPADPLSLLLLVGLLLAFCFGSGLSIAICTRLLPEFRKVIPFITRPLFFLSGVFFPLAVVPEQYRPWLLWNPMLHFLELIRQAYFASYVNSGAEWRVVLVAPLVVCALALLLYRRYRIALVTT